MDSNRLVTYLKNEAVVEIVHNSYQLNLSLQPFTHLISLELYNQLARLIIDRPPRRNP